MTDKKIWTVENDFYEAFRCIAGECSFTCCQEWKIAVDDKTRQRWKGFLKPGGDRRLTEYITGKDNDRVIALAEDGRCPFLREDRLCSLVTEYSAEMLSETCTVFPRELHEFCGREKNRKAEVKRREKSLMTGCPAVVDLLNRAGTFSLKEVNAPEKKDFFYDLRAFAIEHIQNKSYSLETALMMSGYIFLEIYRQKQNGNTDQSMLRDVCRDKAELDRLAEEIIKIKKNMENTVAENNELFLDIIDNYRKENRYGRYIEKAAMAAEKLEKDISDPSSVKKAEEFMKSFSAYEELFRKVIANDCFGNMLIPGGTLRDMVMMMEWSAMTYAVMRHYLFLCWYEDGETALSYENVRTAIVLISRMTGYTLDDIEEYMENSFESAVWDWGYLALIMGK